MYTRLYGFLNKRFYEKHFGFQTRCSTVFEFAEIVKKQRFNMSTKRFCVLLDFSKVFNTVNRDLMIENVENFDVRGVLLSLFSSYFQNRQHTLFINAALSDFKVISSCVPRWSILCTLLFILNTNDFLVAKKFTTCICMRMIQLLCTLQKLWMRDTLVLTFFACKSGSLVINYI